METLTAEKQAPIINFLRTDQKTIDWRYSNYEKLSYVNGTRDHTTIYWLGTVDLLPVRKNESHYPLHMFCGTVSMGDKHYQRDVDGASEGLVTTQYDLSKIMPELLEARDNCYSYYHLLLEETVNRHGSHKVNILSLDSSPSGIPTKLPWFEETTKKWLPFTMQSIPNEVKRTCILSNVSYHWLK